jgi:hypothetical protein
MLHALDKGHAVPFGCDHLDDALAAAVFTV